MNYADTLVCTVYCRPDKPPGPGLLRLQQSCWYHGIDLEVIGFSGNWIHSYHGKLVQLAKHLDHSHYKRVLYLDTEDVAVTRPLPDILAAFETFPTEFVVSAERNVFPFPGRHGPLLPTIYGGYRAPNTGMFIATRQAYLHAMNVLEDERKHANDEPPFKNARDWSIFTEDQGAITEAYIQNKFPISLDTSCKIFQNLWSVSTDLIKGGDLELKEGVITNTHFNTKPCVFHASGGFRKPLEDLMKYFNKPRLEVPQWQRAARKEKVPFYHFSEE